MSAAGRGEEDLEGAAPPPAPDLGAFGPAGRVDAVDLEGSMIDLLRAEANRRCLATLVARTGGVPVPERPPR